MADTEHLNRVRLPSAVYDLAIRLGASPEQTWFDIQLKQIGRMKRNLSTASWMQFTATQTISTSDCAFDWLAKFTPFGVISARDALCDGVGRLDIMAFGLIPIARMPHTPALVRGELMRYLAELAFAPDAILHNAALTWRVISADTLAVSAGTGETWSEVILSLDGEGRIGGAFALDRPRSATAPTLPTPWRGRFSDYRRHCDHWIPFAGEVAWEFDGREHTYWQGQLVEWDLC